MTTAPGKRAVVTGASSGIGYATAVELMREGWAVLAVGRRADRLAVLESHAGGPISTLALDVTDEDAPARIMAFAQERLGGLDLLVNNAGTSCISPLIDTSDEQLDEVLDTNVRAVMRLTRAAIPLLERS